MSFNSYEYGGFLITVFFLYWIIFKKSLKAQNTIILISSIVFYSFWDYRFLLLIFLSTIIDFFIGIQLNKRHKKRLLFLYLSCSINLGMLAFFKYFNFFIDSWIHLLQSIGYSVENNWTLNIILPVGISFYTFQTMSYTIDIYRGKIKPTNDLIAFASFVTFFPQLVAGPIERASSLLPQILNKRKFNIVQVSDGFRLILWGLFKKVVIADNLAPIVDAIFLDYTNYSGGTLLLGAVYFSFQIYCDFSGYSDIAIGTSKLLGIELMSNFKFPYFSKNIVQFWRRWHISLSSWFRDYLYIPLGGSRKSQIKTISNVTIVFLVSGLWHGANWTFLFWGGYHALLYLPFLLSGENRIFDGKGTVENKFLPSFKELTQMLTTFFFVLIGWVFFRSETLKDAFIYLYSMLFQFDTNFTWISGLPILFLFIVLDWTQRKNERKLFNHSLVIRWSLYLFLSVLIFLNFGNTDVDFIYFQF